MIADLPGFLAANGLVLLAGVGVVRLCGLRTGLDVAALSLSYLAGAAAVGVAGSVVLVAGLSFAVWQVVVLCVFLFALGLARRALRPLPPPRPRPRWTRVFTAGTAAVAVLLAVDFAFQPLWAWDAWWIWAAKAKAIAFADGLDAELLRSLANADYPPLVPVLELVLLRFTDLDSELLNLQVGLVLLALPGALVASLRDRAAPAALWPVVLALLLAPALQVQTAYAVADVPLAVFLALAGVLLWRWLELGETHSLALAGVFAAAAVSAKVEGRLEAALLLLVAAALARRRAGAVLAVGAAVAASALPWAVWAEANGLQNQYGAGNPPDLVAELERVPLAAARLVRELVDPTSWLALPLLAAAAIGLALRDVRRAALLAAVPGALSLAVLVGIYWATPLGFEYHLDTSARRVVTPLLVLAAALAPVMLSRQAERS